MPMKRRLPEWGAYVTSHRKQLHLTRRELAYRACIDPSYLTLIERDGSVPASDIVERVAKALSVDVDMTLLIAGYAPSTRAGIVAALKAVAKQRHSPCPPSMLGEVRA